MISFREFLAEAVRDRKRAAMLFLNIDRRQERQGKKAGATYMGIPKQARYPHREADDVGGHHWTGGELPDGYKVDHAEIPIHKIKNSQTGIQTTRAMNLAHEYQPWHPDAHIAVVQRGDHYVPIDGHHRLYVNKALGNKTIKAKIYSRISEAVRTPDRAADLLTRIGARQRKNDKTKGHIDIPLQAAYPHPQVKELRDHIWKGGKLPRKYKSYEADIPIEHIKTTQSDIATSQASKLAREFDPDHPKGSHIHVYYERS